MAPKNNSSNFTLSGSEFKGDL